MTCGSQRKTRPVLLIGAILIAVFSALPYAGSWNDGSRLACVESLVDHHTWSIDHSIFVGLTGAPFLGPDGTPHVKIFQFPGDGAYPGDDLNLIRYGTRDKIYIDGHYYSDKSPVPSLVMAGVYKGLQLVTGLTASKNPGLFSYLLTLIFCGTAYVVSVCCIDAMGATLGVSCLSRLLLSYSFALSTIALPYVRQVNNHIMLLGVFSAVILTALNYTQTDGNKLWRLLLLGSLMGIGYTIDLGVGPILVLCVTGFIIAQTRSWKSTAIVLLAAFPWFLLHHILNYQIGGTFMPANTVAGYFLWPGSPFNPQNLTGGWMHPNLWHFFVYAIDMLFGKKGFIGHNLALYLSLPAIVFLLRNKTGPRILVWFALALIFGTWMIYAATSNNYSGMCCSIRWFVPLLAPFYYLLAVFLKEHPEYSVDLLILAAWGLVLGAVMWIQGPWTMHMEPGFWYFQAAALISWLGYRIYRQLNPATANPTGNHK